MGERFSLISRLDDAYDEILLEIRKARSRIGKKRRVKLGDLNLHSDFYIQLKSIFSEILVSRFWRNRLFEHPEMGSRARLDLLVFMSELVYWEYERSFWQKLSQVLGNNKRQYSENWLREQMERGFEENGIPLLYSQWGFTKRREFVQTIIAESGFSRQLISQAKKFIIWYFDNYSELDPRKLDQSEFRKILETAPFNWEIDEIFELIRDMVFTVNLLLREIRKRSLSSVDLEDIQILSELEEALGFHPVRGIFGFRNLDDIRELLEELSSRVKPENFYRFLRRKIRNNRSSIKIITPDEKRLTISRPKQVPIYYGEYQIDTGRYTGIQVVPRESLSISQLSRFFDERNRVFHKDGPNYAYISDKHPFEVFQGGGVPEEARRYIIGNKSGYLWYGKQKIGIPLSAEHEGNVFAKLDPRSDIRLNPRLRLDWKKNGLEVVIPSFVCFEPNYRGKTVRLELNGRAIENTTYVIGNDGSLQFLSTRAAAVNPGDRELEVRLITLEDENVVTESSRIILPDKSFLFSYYNRENISAGFRNYASDRFILFTPRKEHVSHGPTVNSRFINEFGFFDVYDVRWDTKESGAFKLETNNLKWEFVSPLEVYLSVETSSKNEHFKPGELNSGFSSNDIHIWLNVRGNSKQLPSIWEGLSIILEKDDDFLTDFSLDQLVKMKFLNKPSKNDFEFKLQGVIQYLIGQKLIDRTIGSYRFILMYRQDQISDMESLSEIEFLLLPQFRIEGSDKLIEERKQTFVSIICDSPLMINSDNQNVNVMQLEILPTASFEKKLKQLQVDQIRKSILLSYPPTKLSVEFFPNIFALRFVTSDNISVRKNVSFTDLLRSKLYILADPTSKVLFRIQGSEKKIPIDENGRGCSDLSELIPLITSERTKLVASCETFTKEFQIIWHTSFKFQADKCTAAPLSREKYLVKLFFTVEGPPNTEIEIRIQDNKLQKHQGLELKIQDIKSGTVDFEIASAEIENASILFINAYGTAGQLDALQMFLQKEFVDNDYQLAAAVDQLYAKLESTTYEELPEFLDSILEINYEPLIQKTASKMFSSEGIYRLWQKYRDKEISESQIHDYFGHFQTEYLPKETNIPIYILKYGCALPFPDLVAEFSKILISRNDGEGVFQVIEELMLPGRINWDKGIEILSVNKKCSSNIIKDIVELEEIEERSEKYIDLMIKICEHFYPELRVKAVEAKDWKRAHDLENSSEILSGTVVNNDYRGIYIPFGKLVGMISIDEIDTAIHGPGRTRGKSRKDYSFLINTQVDYTVLEVNRQKNILIFSEKQATKISVRNKLSEIVAGEVYDATVTGIKEFGVFVEVHNIPGLIRDSELSWDKQKRPKERLRIGDRIEVFVIEVDEVRARLSLSLKRLEENPALDKIEIGMVVKGKVIDIKPYGAFIKLKGGIYGLVHISELSVEKIHHPSEVVSVGKTYDFRILDIDYEEGRIRLSLKQVNKEDLYWGDMRVTRSK
jgi:predicted RNA-binding protein with RPS1 domain